MKNNFYIGQGVKIIKTKNEQRENMYYCFGASITEGIPGVSYVKYLGKEFLNYGKGRDTTLDLYNRLKNLLNSQTVENIIIEIGTNDILLPFLYNYSPEWQKKLKKLLFQEEFPQKH
ncbi:SGNH/GDSL hydrolase family protein [Thermosipho globiformans]|uniref:SGNH/GDSL hydrolase family protein n=1 Tax=Thermosipho globiformans TaxID=380685 RepID=UPI001F49617E|nr:SGNH/GDSL hydrolase family protein [Thermosipho globiformans]